MLKQMTRKDWPLYAQTQTTPEIEQTRLKGASSAPADDVTPMLVPAVQRAVGLLDILSTAEEPLVLAELQRRTGFPKSSLHGLLATLAQLGLIYRDDESRYSLGSKCLQWADAYSHQTRVILAFNEATKSMTGLQEETVMLAVLQKDQVHYLGCREGTRALAVKFRVGGNFPAACTSTGKAMLATLSNEHVRSLLDKHGVQRQTRFSVPTVEALIKQLERFRHVGYAIDDEEMAEGMHCFGAPVFTAGQTQAAAAVAVSLIKASTTVRRKQEVIQHIGQLAKDISRRLGAQVRS
jgi:IclR family transcriptional regulator, blcABC operon repressor